MCSSRDRTNTPLSLPPSVWQETQAGHLPAPGGTGQRPAEPADVPGRSEDLLCHRSLQLPRPRASLSSPAEGKSLEKAQASDSQKSPPQRGCDRKLPAAAATASVPTRHNGDRIDACSSVTSPLQTQWPPNLEAHPGSAQATRPSAQLWRPGPSIREGVLDLNAGPAPATSWLSGLDWFLDVSGPPFSHLKQG